MMFAEQLATATDVNRLLGDVDPLVNARILAIAPSVDELEEAVHLVDEEAGFGEEPQSPSTARVGGIREILTELAEAAALEQDPAYDAARGSLVTGS
jgi:hypothetical protein